MLDWKIGCSGYHFSEWNRIFYPADLSPKKWFEYYSRQFNSLELNNTFYKFPKIDSLTRLYETSPEDFKITVKAPRLITHYKRLGEAQEALGNFYATVQEGLSDKLGFVLFQFPSTFVYEEHRLERIVNLLDSSLKNVVEFRHESWWRKDVFDAFSQNSITFCSMSHPNLPSHPVKTTQSIYYRFHGVPQLYFSRYSVEALEEVASAIQQENSVTEAYIYFNNTAEAAAVANAKEFQDICQEVPK